MDHAYSDQSEKIKTLIERRYSRSGKNYCYVTGKAGSSGPSMSIDRSGVHYSRARMFIIRSMH